MSNKKLRVGMDISQTAFIGGVATYTKELAEQLAKTKDLDIVFFYSSLRKPYKGSLPHVHTSIIPPTLSDLLFNQLRALSIDQFLENLDIYHSSDWVQSKSQAKKVTTYHDVIPLKYPEWSDPKVIKVHKRRLQLITDEIDQVIAVSESTKKDLMEISEIGEDKITVVYEGVSNIFRPHTESEINEFRKKMGLPDRFILAIGGVGKRRNLDRVKEATKDYSLVVTSELKNRPTNEEMPILYSAADALLYPSLYEGFGLPVLEAMACGTPVVTSNISSLPEVGGEACLYVDPLDIEDIKAKVRTIMIDKSTREKLIKSGFKQAAKFSWEKCAMETVEVYRRLMQ